MAFTLILRLATSTLRSGPTRTPERSLQTKFHHGHAGTGRRQTRPSRSASRQASAGVDPISLIDIQTIIRHLKERGIAVLITDHNVRETLGICDRAYILFEGTCLAEGEPGYLLEHPEVRRVYLGEQFKL